MKNINKLIGASLLALSLTLNSCFDNYLDIVPDNIATIDNAFAMRVTAERFLFTCYSYLPNDCNFNESPGLMTADEFWAVYGGSSDPESYNGNALKIARGLQGVTDPLINYWDGEQNGKPLFRAIRECNIFLENVDKIPDIEELERENWRGEVKFLKAFYHFLLVRMYGPIPITDTNLPISATVDEVKIYRDPIDDCFDYIAKTIDEAIEILPDVITDMTTQKGRIDKCVAKAMKAKILVYAASPLFNGNSDYVNFWDSRNNQPYFNQTVDQNKWQKAAEACQEAVRYCEANGFSLHRFAPSATQQYSETTINQLSYREALTERTNQELIWGNVKSQFGGGKHEQAYCLSRGIVGNTGGTTGNIAVPLKMVEMFHTVNGVPLDEDKTRNYGARYNLRTVTPDESVNLINGYITADLNFDREDRFYGALGFDGGKLFGQGKTKENEQYNINMKFSQSAGITRTDCYIITGYFPKKLVNYQTILNSSSTTARYYVWPIIRLADLYLLYAEALNEATGPNDESIRMLNMVRERSGLKGIKESWDQFSKTPNKYKTQEGLREIIRRERTIELMFEGERFWDIRRWKTATQEMNEPIRGWNMYEKTEESYYKPVTLFELTFSSKQYFWPIKEKDLQVNRNLVQNQGW